MEVRVEAHALKMASVVTGSVELMSDAKSMASLSVNGYENPRCPLKYMIAPTTRVLVNVPRNAKTEMASKFLKSVSGLSVARLEDHRGQQDEEEKLRVKHDPLHETRHPLGLLSVVHVHRVPADVRHDETHQHAEQKSRAGLVQPRDVECLIVAPR